jgi:hypothetical protein
MEMTKMQKKGQMTGVLLPIVAVAIILVVIAIVLGVGQNLLSDTKADVMRGETQTATCNVTSGIATSCGYATNATIGMQTGLGKVSDKFPLIGTVIVLVIIIGLLFMVFQYIRTR